MDSKITTKSKLATAMVKRHGGVSDNVLFSFFPVKAGAYGYA